MAVFLPICALCHDKGVRQPIGCLIKRLIKLATELPTPVEADGELVGLTPLEVAIFPRAFQVAAEKLRGS